MSYNVQSLYLTWGGTLGTTTGPEIWQSGVHFAAPVGDPTPTLPSEASLAGLLSGAIAAFHADPDMWISSSAFLSFAKAALIDTDGSYITEAVQVEDTPVAGGSTVTVERSGMQDATVVSLWSGLTLGRANYGRFYTPWSNAQITASTGKVASGIVDDMADAAQTFVNALNTWGAGLADPGQVAILSKVGSGALKFPNFVRVGDVRDTQRRRRNAIDETYSSRAI